MNVGLLDTMHEWTGFTPLNDIDDEPILGRNFDLAVPSFPLGPDYNGGSRTNEDVDLRNILPEFTVPGVEFMTLPDETRAASWVHNSPVINSGEETREEKSLPISTQIAQKLAELSIDLGKHAASLPSLAVHDCRDAYASFPAATETPANGSATTTQNGSLFSPKRTFQLTQSLISLYSQLTKTNLRVSPPTRPFSSNATNSAAAKENYRSMRNYSTFSTTQEVLDHALILQVLSCHHRVTDTWDLIFSHVRKGLESGSFGPCLIEMPPCQRLRIGNFIPLTKVPLEILLSLEFLQQLLNQVKQLVERISSMQHIDETAVIDGIRETGVFTTYDPNIEGTKNAGMTAIARSSDLVRKAYHMRDLIENQNGVDV